MINQKRGQSLSVSTIVIIVLSLVVLVFLIYGFSVGWGNLFENITNIGGGSSNVNSITQACSIACSTRSTYEYNDLDREVKLGDGTEFMATCEDLESDLDGCYVEGKKVTGEGLTREKCTGSGNYVEGDSDEAKNGCFISEVKVNLDKESCQGKEAEYVAQRAIIADPCNLS